MARLLPVSWPSKIPRKLSNQRSSTTIKVVFKKAASWATSLNWTQLETRFLLKMVDSNLWRWILVKQRVYAHHNHRICKDWELACTIRSNKYLQWVKMDTAERSSPNLWLMLLKASKMTSLLWSRSMTPPLWMTVAFKVDRKIWSLYKSQQTS